MRAPLRQDARDRAPSRAKEEAKNRDVGGDRPIDERTHSQCHRPRAARNEEAMHRIIAQIPLTLVVLASNIHCDPNYEQAEESVLTDTPHDSDELASDPPQARPNEQPATPSADEQEMLRLTRTLYRRHLAGYPGGQSRFEQRFEAALAESGGVSDEYLADYGRHIEQLLADVGADEGGDDDDSPVDGDRLAALMRPTADGALAPAASELKAPDDPSFAVAQKFRFKAESFKLLACGDDAGSPKCATEEPIMVWCVFWPAGSVCGVSDEASVPYGAEMTVRGSNNATTGIDPTAVMTFFQIVELDTTYNKQKYTDALTTASALIKAGSPDWANMTSVPTAFKSFWNQSINAIKGTDDPMTLFADVYKLADLKARTAQSSKFLSDCLMIKKISECTGNYSLQSVVTKLDVFNAINWYRIALSISAVP